MNRSDEFPPEPVPLHAIRIDGGTQSRTAINKAVVTEYSDALRKGALMPPVMLYFDGTDFWLADGFHRFHAHQAIGSAEISAVIRTGTRRDAVLYAASANATHGQRRSNKDRRHAVQMLLEDPEWATWSDNAIAKACAVSQPLVASVRRSLTSNSSCENPAPRTYTTKHGSTATMSTTKIGRKKTAPKKEGVPAQELNKDATPKEIETSESMYGQAPISETELDLLPLMQHENAILVAQVEAFQVDDRDVELERQIRIRFGIERRLQQEMEHVYKLDKRLRYFDQQFSKLRKLVDVEENSQIVERVRNLLTAVVDETDNSDRHA